MSGDGLSAENAEGDGPLNPPFWGTLKRECFKRLAALRVLRASSARSAVKFVLRPLSRPLRLCVSASSPVPLPRDEVPPHQMLVHLEARCHVG